MKIAVFYNRLAVETPLAMYFINKKYVSKLDPAGKINTVEMYDITGVDQTDSTATITGMSAATYHRIITLCPTATDVYSSLAATQITALAAKLITTSGNPLLYPALSDDHVLSIAPASFPSTLLHGKNQAQTVWNMLFSFNLKPLYKGSASAGANTTLTDAAATWTVNELKGYWLYVISGTGYGQYQKIVSNTATVITVTANWLTNPAANSVYQICTGEPKGCPQIVSDLGGGMADFGTASAGGATTITDGTKTWVVNHFSKLNCYVYIYAGTGNGQYRQIISNTATALTVKAWDTNPDTSSKYAIVYNVNQVLAYEYFNRYLWLYCNDPANSNCVVLLNKLFDNLNNINDTVQYPISQDAAFINNTVIPIGKALYDSSIGSLAPVTPNVKFTELTSGTLVVGKTYYIQNWITADDFANVGGANVDGTTFIATGTTPTTWTNSSVLIAI